MIKLSKKWDYSLKSILYLASRKWQLVKISDISKDLEISETFLRRIINDFEKSNLIKTLKWRNGWVIFEKDLEKVSLYDIFSSVWEDLFIANCTSWVNCTSSWKCESVKILNSLQKWFNTLLKIHTLDKIINKN